jgi:hypothetical protein
MFSSSSWSYSSSDVSDDELYKYTYKMTSLPLASTGTLAKNDGGRRKRIPWKQTSERLGGAMLTAGLTPWRRWCRERRGERAAAASRAMASGHGAGATAWGDGAGRRRREEVRARWIYGAAASYSAVGGWNRPAAAKSCGGGVGGKWRARAGGGEFQPVGHSRASEELPRTAADASHLVLRIVQTPARPKKIAAPPRIPRLLEGRFRLRARYTGGFFSAPAL